MVRLLLVWLVSFAALAGALPDAALAAPDGGRVALIIGNSAYPTAPLKNPANDAADLAYALEKKGFNVLLRENVGERGLKEAVEEFAKFLKGGGVGLFFFAGHGAQFRDQNYLVPVDVSFQNEADIAYKSVSAEYVLARMAEAGNRVNVVVLDACRNNPFQSARAGRAKGLSVMSVGQAEKGTFIAYATSPGSTAADGEGRNGLYTKHLLRSLEMKDSDIDKVFGRVRSGVVQDTGGQQVPWTSSSIIGNFYFEPGDEQATAAQPVAPTTLVTSSQEKAAAAADSDAEYPPYDPAEERAVWARVRGSSSAADYQEYLGKFPGGPNAAFARFRLKRLGAPVPAAAPRTSVAATPQPTPQQLAALAPTPMAPATPKPAPPAAVKPEPAADAVLRDCADCPELVTVPRGEYTMGSDAGEADREPDEGPLHQVRIAAPLAVGKFEVSRGEFAAFAQDTGLRAAPGCNSTRGGRFARLKTATWQAPGFTQTAKDPVVCVSWDEAQAYVTWLSGKTGKPYRLLSEAEWEYAARAGGPSGRYWGTNSADACRFANVADQAAQRDVPNTTLFACRDSYAQTAPTGSFAANGFGLFDMLGNAWEWVEDCWNKNYEGAPDNGAARSSGTCDERVFRGGAWNSKPATVRSGYRDREERGERHDNLGFRVARPID